MRRDLGTPNDAMSIFVGPDDLKIYGAFCDEHGDEKLPEKRQLLKPAVS